MTKDLATRPSSDVDAPRTPPGDAWIRRLKQSDPVPREIAWQQYHGRHAPIIVAFAQRLEKQITQSLREAVAATDDEH
jgi:hypothetical protein